MADLDSVKQELEQLRDEIKLKMHLASLDAKEEWGGLEKKWDDFNARADLSRAGDDIGSAASLLGEELKQAFKRFKDAL
ncbi:MAG: hypothetical protein V2I57_02505 [Xanthomonadales bacterium]|jgi:hypothetical protein|nr:hypothetical protein [Xanthomonadales bacterium]